MSEFDDAVADYEDTARQDDGREECPICGFRAKRLDVHMKKHEANGSAPAGSSNGRGGGRTVRLDTNSQRVNVAEEEERLVQSLVTVGMFVAPIVPHTGLTIVSRAPDRQIPIPNAAPVQKRGIASIAIEYGKRDPRIMRGIVRFNNLMHGGDAFELAASLAAAVAVDVHLVDPHLELPVPGVPAEVRPQPVMMLIGDVVMDIEQRVAQQAQPKYEPEPEEAGAPA